MLKFLLIAFILFIGYIALRIYMFLKATHAPILKGKRQLGIRYKKGRKLDVYFPTKQVFDQTPVVVFFHGGGWVFGSRKAVNNSRFNGAVNELREKGYAVISPAYTLAKRGRSPFPDCMDDAEDAIAWIEQNAKKFKFDTNNVGVLGESAGAHIGLMTSYATGSPFSDGHNISIKYMVDVYGPTDLHRLFLDLEHVLEGISNRVQRMPTLMQGHFDVGKKLFGFDPKDDRERTLEFTKKYSPIDFAHAQAPPTMIVHGDRDPLVPISQSYLLKEKLDALKVPNKIYIIEGMSHAFRGASLRQRKNTQDWIVDFVTDHYQVGKSIPARKKLTIA